MRYYALSGTTEAKRVLADEEWLANCRDQLFPSGCKHMTPQPPVDRVVVNSIPGATALSWVSPIIDVQIAEDDLLLDMLGPDGMKAVKLFPVVVRHGSRHKKYSAFVPKLSVLVRGRSMSTLKGACEKCRRLYYWPRPTREPGKWYLVRGSVRDEAPVYSGSAVRLILREDVFERVKRLNLTTVRLRELPTLDQPLDGLPAALPPFVSPDQQRDLGDLLTRDVTDQDRQWAQRMGNAKEIEKGRIVEWVPPKRRE